MRRKRTVNLLLQDTWTFSVFWTLGYIPTKASRYVASESAEVIAAAGNRVD